MSPFFEVQGFFCGKSYIVKGPRLKIMSTNVFTNIVKKIFFFFLLSNIGAFFFIGFDKVWVKGLPVTLNRLEHFVLYSHFAARVRKPFVAHARPRGIGGATAATCI